MSSTNTLLDMMGLNRLPFDTWFHSCKAGTPISPAPVLSEFLTWWFFHFKVFPVPSMTTFFAFLTMVSWALWAFTFPAKRPSML